MSVSSDSPLVPPAAEPIAASLRGVSATTRSQTPLARIAPTDGELLTLFVKKSDRAAFDRLVDRHAAMVWRVCRQALRRPEDAEDAFQATFLLLVRNARSIRSSDSAAGWLYRVAYRTAVRARKRLAARREESLALDPEAPAEVAFPDLLRKQTTGVLMEELRRLPSQYQTAMVLRYLEGQSRRAIADQTDTTVAAVQGRLARGKRMLRRRLLRRGVSLSVAMGAVGLASRRSEAAEAAPAQLVAQTTTHSAALASGGSLAASAAVMSLYREGAQAMLLTFMAKPAAAAAACGLAALVLMQPSPAAGPALHEESIVFDAAVPAPATRGEHTTTQLLASTAQVPGKASSSQPVSDDLTRADAESNTDLLKWMHKLKRLPTFDGRNRGVPVGEKEPLSYEQREARIRDRWLQQLHSLDDPIDLASATWEEQEAQFQAAKERYNQLEKRVSFLLQRRAENKANLTPEEWIEVELEVGGLFADLAQAKAEAIRLKRDLLSRAADTVRTPAQIPSAARGEPAATLTTDGRLQVNPDEPGELKITSADGRQALQIAYEPEENGATASINASLSQPTERAVARESTRPTFAGPHATANQQVRDALRRPLPDEGLRLDNIPLSEAIKLIAEEYDIEARLDVRSLDELGISPDEPVSVDMGRGSLSAALEILLEQLELQAVPRQGVLTVVTNDRAAKMLAVGVYQVGDLLAAHPAMTSQLTETIQRMVEPASWGVNGGDAEVSLLPTGTLAVSQTQRGHEQLAALLDSLRTESKGPAAQQSATPTPHSGSVVDYWDDGSKKSVQEYDDGRLMYAAEYTAEGQQTLAYEDEGPRSEASAGAATVDWRADDAKSVERLNAHLERLRTAQKSIVAYGEENSPESQARRAQFKRIGVAVRLLQQQIADTAAPNSYLDAIIGSLDRDSDAAGPEGSLQSDSLSGEDTVIVEERVTSPLAPPMPPRPSVAVTPPQGAVNPQPIVPPPSAPSEPPSPSLSEMLQKRLEVLSAARDELTEAHDRLARGAERQLEVAQAQLGAEKAQLAVRAAELDRKRKLAKDGLGTQLKVQQAEAELKKAEASLKKAEAEVAKAQTDLAAQRERVRTRAERLESEIERLRNALPKLPPPSSPPRAPTELGPFDSTQRLTPQTQPASSRHGKPKRFGGGGRTETLHKPSEHNPNGWATVADLKVGGSAPVLLPNDERPRPEIVVEALTPKSVTVYVEDRGHPEHHTTVEVAVGEANAGTIVVRGRPIEVVYKGPSERLGGPDQPGAGTEFAALVVRGQHDPERTATKPARRIEHHDGKADGKKSLGGSGHLIRFELPEGVTRVKSIRVHGSRYGTPKAPDEDFEIGFLSEDRNEILAVEHAPYGLFRRGEERWVTVRFDEPVALPPTFWLGLDFNPGRTKGVYVSYDTSTGGERSMTGRTQGEPESHKPVEFAGDWMVALIPERAKNQAAALTAPPSVNPFAALSLDKR